MPEIYCVGLDGTLLTAKPAPYSITSQVCFDNCDVPSETNKTACWEVYTLQAAQTPASGTSGCILCTTQIALLVSTHPLHLLVDLESL